jgi:transcriptional regulator with XRE-family HTH domain
VVATSTPVDLLQGRRLAFGRRLRRLRQTHNVSGEELAQRASISQPKVSRLETGKVTPAPVDVQRIADALQLPPADARELVAEAEEIAGMARNLRKERQIVGLSGLQEHHGDIEAMCQQFHDLALGILPGLVQTPEYARAMMRLLEPQPSEQEIAEGVAERITRQTILDDELRSFLFLISAETLDVKFGSVDTLHVQLLHLRALSRRPNVSVRVLDYTKPMTALPPLHGFVIYDDLSVNVELLDHEVWLSDRATVRLYRRNFDQLWESALDDEATSAVISSKLAELDRASSE